jgi:hypothetical protein
MNNTTKLFLTLVLAFYSLGQLSAKEGMWIPALLEAVEQDMQSLGLTLSAADIYSINEGSLKDAIVHFGGGCTAELISNQGLLLTNHHCGFSQIQSHSSVENDYLTHGFWAMSRDQELSNSGLTATFIQRIEDVTARVNEGVKAGMSAADLAALELKNMLAIEAEFGQNGLKANVIAFNYGNDYYVIVTKTYLDVRLVGAPPSSVGKFGGDTDNWMWPRHTGDFSMFRIYAGIDNEPAEYSEENVPYRPAHHLPVSMSGVEEGDFTMVYGFPGRTEVYLTSYAVEYTTDKANPMRIGMREKSLSIIDAAMMSSDAIRIQYAAKQSRISNAYKKWIGQNKGLEILGAIQLKRDQEMVFASKSESNRASLANMEKAYADLEKYSFGRDLLIEYFYYGPEFLRYCQSFTDLVESYATLDKEQIAEKVEKLKAATSRHFKDYHTPTDRAIFESLTTMYINYIDQDLRPTSLISMKGNADAVAKLSTGIYDKGYFANEEKMMSLLNSFGAKSVKKLKSDPAYILSAEVLKVYDAQIKPEFARLTQEIDVLMKDYVVAMEAVFPDRVYWPDANSTLRLTYGKAEGSAPRDGMIYKFYTTSDGILEKYIPEHRDFDLPPSLVEMLESRDFGPYATNGELRVCFTGSNHTTGGNSGSPAMDGNGYLIGLNFDRTWESTMSDIMFDPDRCRNIMVDIKYVLFIIDKYAGATHLINEMTLVYPKSVEKPEMDVAPVGEKVH